MARKTSVHGAASAASAAVPTHVPRALDGECATGERGSYSTPHEKTRTGVTSTMTTSDSSSAASSGYCGYFA